MYKYQFLFTNFNDENFYKTIVADKDLNDEQIQHELSMIFDENNNVKDAILDKVVITQWSERG